MIDFEESSYPSHLRGPCQAVVYSEGSGCEAGNHEGRAEVRHGESGFDSRCATNSWESATGQRLKTFRILCVCVSE